MTDQTPKPGTDTGLPEYLDAMQSKASRLSGVLKACAFLVDEGACKEGQDTLIYLCEALARDLSNALDAVNRPYAVTA